MSLATRLESLREVALLAIDKLDDEVLLTKDLERMAERIAEHHYLAPPRLHRVVITTPRAVLRAGPGEPGQEHALVVAPATRVELWLLVDGFATLALLAEGDDLDLGEAEINADDQCLVLAFVAEHPIAEVANEFFQRSLYDVEGRVGRVRGQVEAYNESLRPAVTEALQAARGRAKERRRFAAALTLPHPKEPREHGWAEAPATYATGLPPASS
jgi:hypothetical protein